MNAAELSPARSHLCPLPGSTLGEASPALDVPTDPSPTHVPAQPLPALSQLLAGSWESCSWSAAMGAKSPQGVVRGTKVPLHFCLQSRGTAESHVTLLQLQLPGPRFMSMGTANSTSALPPTCCFSGKKSAIELRPSQLTAPWSSPQDHHSGHHHGEDHHSVDTHCGGAVVSILVVLTVLVTTDEATKVETTTQWRPPCHPPHPATHAAPSQPWHIPLPFLPHHHSRSPVPMLPKYLSTTFK